MADNVKYTEPGSGTVFATDDVTGVHYQIIKLAYGVLDTATLVTASVGLPVSDAGGSLTVDNAGTFATQSAITAASGSLVDGALATLGAKADAKSAATDTTAVTAMSVLKQISASVQAPPGTAVTNAGTFATQSAITAASGSLVDGALATLGTKADAKSTATDTTAITAMSVLKQISASVQAPPGTAVTNVGTFATQSAITAASGSLVDGALATLGTKADAKSTATDTTAVTAISILKQISASVQAPPGTAVTNTGTFATQSAITAASGSLVDGALATLGAKADAKSTATDTTVISAMSVLKQISASVQAPPSQAVTNTGTFATQAAVAGDVAHGASNSGNPLQTGFEAIAHGTNPSAVTAGQRTKAYANRAGVGFVIGGHPNVKTVRLQFTAAQTNVAIVTVATGLKIVVTAIQVTLDNASTVFPSVLIGFATATTPTTTGVIAAHAGLPAGGGFSRGDGSGILGIGADDEDLRITTVGAATGGGVEVVVTYYTIES